MTAKESFALRLYAIRENKGLSRQKVADDLGISRASLEYYEKGKRTPDINTIELIAEYFGISIDYLLGVTDCQSYDTDIRQICDYTGLSEDVIELLHENKKKHKYVPPKDKLCDIRQQIDILQNTLHVLQNIYYEIWEKNSDSKGNTLSPFNKGKAVELLRGVAEMVNSVNDEELVEIMDAVYKTDSLDNKAGADNGND